MRIAPDLTNTPTAPAPASAACGGTVAVDVLAPFTVRLRRTSIVELELHGERLTDREFFVRVALFQGLEVASLVSHADLAVFFDHTCGEGRTQPFAPCRACSARYASVPFSADSVSSSVQVR